MSAAEEFFKRISDLADELFDPEDSKGKEKYVNEHMKQRGFKAVTTWADPDEGDGDGNVSGLFGNSSRERRNTRRTDRDRDRRRASGGSLFYDD